MVKDIYPGNYSSNPRSLTDVNGTLYFVANDGIHGFELWKSYGTAAGTSMVMDIAPGTAESRPTDLTNVNGTLYFTADDGVHGVELWKLAPLVTGDLNRNGQLDAGDVSTMMTALTLLATYQADQQLSTADVLTVADLNHDGVVTNADLQVLLNLLKTGDESGSGGGGGSGAEAAPDRG